MPTKKIGENLYHFEVSEGRAVVSIHQYKDADTEIGKIRIPFDELLAFLAELPVEYWPLSRQRSVTANLARLARIVARSLHHHEDVNHVIRLKDREEAERISEELS